MIKKHLSFILKTIVTFILILLLFYIVDWRESLRIIKGISIPMFILLLGIGLFMIAISCLKWQIFLHARNIHVPLYHLILLYLAGYFFNNFMPSNVGGDLARGMILGRQLNNLSDSFSSVFLERFTGFLGLLILACIVFVFNMELIHEPSIGVFLFLFLLVFLFIAFLLLSERSRKLFVSILNIYPFRPIKNKMIKVLDIIYYFRGRPLVLTQAMLISFLFHFMTVVNTLVVCIALNISVRILDLATIVPIILLLSALPISLNGLGIWEGSFVYFFTVIGIDSSAALSIALVLRAKNLILSLLGGFGLLALRHIALPNIETQSVPESNANTNS